MEWLKSYLKGNTDRGKYDSGAAMYEMGAVSGAYAKKQGTEVVFYGNVIDEYRRQTYSTLVRINQRQYRILESNCDCQSIVSYHSTGGLCPHAVAITLKGIELLTQQVSQEAECVVLTPGVEMCLSALRRGGLGLAFSIEGIDKSQYRKIFTAYKEKKKRLYLGGECYLNLETPNLEKALNLIDLLGVYNEIENIVIPAEKALFLEKQIQNMDFVQNKSCVEQAILKQRKIQVKTQLSPSLNQTLRTYQKEGVQFLATVAQYGLGGILADEMGLGKTLQVIAFLSAQTSQKALVITPTALIYNWEKEWMRFAPWVKVGVVHGSKEKRQAVLKDFKAYDVILTTYHTYRNDEAFYENQVWDYCILDEAQYIKNPKAELTRTVKRIPSQVRFALTGTPIENQLMELWSIMDFVLPGYLYSALRFQNIFMTEPPQVEALKKLIDPFILRRTKKEVLTELPEKIEQKHWIPLENHHQKAYLAMQKLIQQKLDQEPAAQAALLAYLTKLRQICLIPERLVKQYKGVNSKMEYLVSLLKELKEKKTLVFSQFTTVLQAISKRLDEEGIAYHYLDGQTEAKERVALVEDFNHNSEKKVFLISLKAGGTGLNLTSATTVIHFDPWWNPAVENQATDRAHRMGQKHVVHVIKLIAKGTIEERMIALQEEKQALIEQILEGQQMQQISHLTKEEIQKLLVESVTI